MIKKYTTSKPINELTEYMDTLVRYLFGKLQKSKDKHDTIYYPAHYLYRENLDEFKDSNYLDEGYKTLTITLRKVTNSSSVIIVKMDMESNDWRYPMLNSLYKKSIDAIDNSLNNYQPIKKEK